jgi:hypothetical protein
MQKRMEVSLLDYNAECVSSQAIYGEYPQSDSMLQMPVGPRLTP